MEPHGGLFTLETGFGYHVRGSNYHTVMAYPTARHNEWIPYFSADRFRFRGLPIGDPLNDNRRTLLENRFLVAMTGSEGSLHYASALRLLSRDSLRSPSPLDALQRGLYPLLEQRNKLGSGPKLASARNAIYATMQI